MKAVDPEVVKLKRFSNRQSRLPCMRASRPDIDLQAILKPLSIYRPAIAVIQCHLWI